MNERKALLQRLVADLRADIPSIKASAESVTVETIERSGVVQSSFADFNLLLATARPEIFHRHSAFYIYHTDAMFFARRALREAVCSYYGAAGSLLRSACEAILRGAFWECLAHKRYRDHAGIVGEPKRKRKIEGIQRNVLDWMNDVFQKDLHSEVTLEEESGAIFDRISALFKNKVLLLAVPPLKTMVEQLNAWKMFEPLPDAVSEIYSEVYGPLCEDTHLIPDKTMMGRLMVGGRNPSTLFEPSQEEFSRFLDLLQRVAEVGALVMLNVLEDDARTDGSLRAEIASRQRVAEIICLPRVIRKIQTLAA